MATDLTEVLLRRQAGKYGPDNRMMGGEWNAGNNTQLISQGIGNILNSIDAPAQRQEAARQEAIAASQVAYGREQDSIANQLRFGDASRADARLELDKATADRQRMRDAKADVAAAANTALLGKAGELGTGITQLVDNNKSILSELGSQVTVNPDGSFSLQEGATAKQKKRFADLRDVDGAIRDARQTIAGFINSRANDGVQGNEPSNIGVASQLFNDTYSANTQPTQSESAIYQGKLSVLGQQRDEALRQTTGQLGGNPELLSIQSDLASLPSGDPSQLGKDIVFESIKANPYLEDDALTEVNDWIAKAKKGDFGNDIKSTVASPWGNYYLSKAIQRSGGDPLLGVGSFEDSALAESYLNTLRQADTVRNVVKQQGEINDAFNANKFRLDALYGAGTSGRVNTK